MSEKNNTLSSFLQKGRENFIHEPLPPVYIIYTSQPNILHDIPQSGNGLPLSMQTMPETDDLCRAKSAELASPPAPGMSRWERRRQAQVGERSLPKKENDPITWESELLCEVLSKWSSYKSLAFTSTPYKHMQNVNTSIFSSCPRHKRLQPHPQNQCLVSIILL